MSRLAVAVALFFSITASAEDLREYRVLVPIPVQQTSGAYGSQWVSELTIHNDSQYVVGIRHSPNCYITCPPSFMSIPSKASLRPTIGLRNAGGVPLQVAANAFDASPVEKLTFTMNVRDVTRHVRCR